MKIALTLLTLIFSISLFSQYCPYLGPDLTLPCGVNQTTLTADLSQCGPGSQPKQTTSYGVTNIPYVAQNNTGTNVFLTDDSQTGPFNIGFNFCFYGQTYNQFYIGSNGWISFSSNQPTTFTSTSIPNAGITIPKNCIMGPWQDWNPGIGGQIKYQVLGTAPCRKLVVSWIGVPMFSCTNLQGTFHIVIYESTNIIENHIANKPNCPQWAGGTAVQGIHDLLGTSAVTVPGRNSTQWSTINNSYRYTPQGPTVTPTYTWFQVGNVNSIGTGLSIVVNPPPQGAYYTCIPVYPTCNSGWSVCNSGVGLGPDTIHVTLTPNLPPPTITPIDPLCNNTCNGSIVVAPIGGTQPFNIIWNNGGNTLTLNNLCSGNYTFTLTDGSGCVYNGATTLNNPPPLQQPTITPTDPICFNDCNGSATVNPISGLAPYTYLWSNGQTTQTATNLCFGNYSVVVTDLNGCVSNQTTTLNNPPQVTINPITGFDTVCFNSTSNLYNVTSNFLNLTYNWTSQIGTITLGQTSNSVNLNVSGVNSGLYANTLSVIGVNQLGCQSQPQTFTIYDLNVIPQISQIDSLCEYDNCQILVANPPGGQFTGQNVSQNQYCPNLGFIGIDNITYQYQQSGCSFFANSQIQVFGRPQISVTPQNQFFEICDGDSVHSVYTVNSPSVGWNQWIILSDTIVSSQLNWSWTGEGIFTFEVTRWSNGCQSNPEIVAVTLQLCPNELIWIPNTFTPDGDEYNQYFTPVITSGVDIYQYQMQIFNRWGEIVWESFDVSSKWDGTYNGSKCADGVYSWQIRFGVPKTDEVKEMRGHLTILK